MEEEVEMEDEDLERQFVEDFEESDDEVDMEDLQGTEMASSTEEDDSEADEDSNNAKKNSVKPKKKSKKGKPKVEIEYETEAASTLSSGRAKQKN